MNEVKITDTLEIHYSSLAELAGICVISQTNLILPSPRYLSSSLMTSVG